MFDEAKLTAYALGELDAEETKQVEGWLERDPSLQSIVDEVRECATALEESFAEAYALYRGDPAALKRLRPGAFSWFKSAGHRKAIAAALKGMPKAL